MKKKKIVLQEVSHHTRKMLNEARKKAKVINLQNILNEENLKLLASPDSNENYLINSDLTLLECYKGRKVPIKNGIPDFTIFSDNALDEKKKQIDFHDDEEKNESFEEIVLRPYNYSRFHAYIWLKHLYQLVAETEKIIGRDFSTLKILNCGCGGGFEAQFFAEQGGEVVGFDISQLRVEASSTRFAYYGLEGSFYRGEATILPFKDDSFDAVIYHDSLHHVPIEEIPIAIKEARRVSRNLIILSEAHDSPIRMFLESIGWSISVEASGNYTFRFKKSLIEFWCLRFGMDLLKYEVSLAKREHRPKIYSLPIIGKLYYYSINFFSILFKYLGNEALIIMKKSDVKY